MLISPLKSFSGVDVPIRRYRQLSVLTLSIIVVLLLMPGWALLALQQWLAQWWPWPSSEPFSDGSFDKVTHGALFALCAYFTVRGWGSGRRHDWVALGFLLTGFSGLTETLQMMVPGRNGSVVDVLADVIGIMLGIAWGMRPKITAGYEWRE